MVECSTLHVLTTLLAVLRLGFQYLGLIAAIGSQEGCRRASHRPDRGPGCL